jgi:hypothetical protein
MIVPVTVCIVTLPAAGAQDDAATAAAAAAAASAAREVETWGISQVFYSIALNPAPYASHATLCCRLSSAPRAKFSPSMLQRYRPFAHLHIRLAACCDL